MSQLLALSGLAIPPELFTYLPTIALALSAAWFLSGRLVVDWKMIQTNGFGSLNSGSSPPTSVVDGRRYVVVSRRGIVLALQITVGALVTFGGTAYVSFALSSLGTAFGSGHLLVGISGLVIGIVALGRKELMRNALLGVNAVTIAYSVFSDSAAGVLTLLPTDAFHDSVIGTAVAVALSASIIYLLARQ